MEIYIQHFDIVITFIGELLLAGECVHDVTGFLKMAATQIICQTFIKNQHLSAVKIKYFSQFRKNFLFST